MRVTGKSIISAITLTTWSISVGLGAGWMWHYEFTAGPGAAAPLAWPTAARISRSAGLATLVVLIHPHCPCSRATLDELARLMTDCQGKLSATVMILAPGNFSESWVHSDLWSSAAAIPGVTVVADRDGAGSRRFGAATSGQALLYSAQGKLLFAGGITASRGHSGDNAGRSAIEALVLGDAAVTSAPVHTAVYGCPLFNPSAASHFGNPQCPR
jgi:hypothetical protein